MTWWWGQEVAPEPEELAPESGNGHAWPSLGLVWIVVINQSEATRRFWVIPLSL